MPDYAAGTYLDPDNDNCSDITPRTSKPYSNQDLIELVRAIKIAKPGSSIRTVHNEITENIPKAGSYGFLKDVKLNDVKKVWKNAMKSGPIAQPKASKENTNSFSSDILNFYTVGDGSVQSLARNHTLRQASLVFEEETAAKALEGQQQSEEWKKYVHCFLDVPADTSGNRPHQALINFNENKHNEGAKQLLNVGVNKGNETKTGVSMMHQANPHVTGKDEKEIVKIQVAAALPGVEKAPMLLYNVDRTARTFIHPPIKRSEKKDGEDDCVGYDTIRDLIHSHGITGAISGGGTKAYFYARITRRKDGHDIVSIDVNSGLVPLQPW